MRRLTALLAILGLSLCGAGICWAACDDDGPDDTCGPTCDTCTCCASSRALDFAHPPETPFNVDLGSVEAPAQSLDLPPLPDDIAHVPRPVLS